MVSSSNMHLYVYKTEEGVIGSPAATSMFTGTFIFSSFPVNVILNPPY